MDPNALLFRQVLFPLPWRFFSSWPSPLRRLYASSIRHAFALSSGTSPSQTGKSPGPIDHSPHTGNTARHHCRQSSTTCRQALHLAITHHTCTKRHLLSLIGKLAFACKVSPAGRIFLRRLLDTAHSVDQLEHKIHIDDEALQDILWWQNGLVSAFYSTATIKRLFRCGNPVCHAVQTLCTSYALFSLLRLATIFMF